MPSMVGILGRAPDVDEKVWCFFVCFLYVFFVTLWNDEVCDNGNDMKQYNFQNNYGVIAYRKVCSCASMFKFSYWPPRIFPDGHIFYQKNTIFGDFWCHTATVLKLQRWNFARHCGPGAPSPRQNFVKIALFGENVYHKLSFLAIFWAVSPHLLSQNGKIWREGAYLGDPLHAKFLKNHLRGYTPLGQIIHTKNYRFRRFCGL